MNGEGNEGGAGCEREEGEGTRSFLPYMSRIPR